MNFQPRRNPYLFLTGATGFIGHVLLGELLRRGQRCVVLLREPRQKSLGRLRNLLSDLQIDLDEKIAREDVIISYGDLADGELPPPPPGVVIDRIVHGAGSTRFEANEAGEPSRTNREGTENLLNWATAHDIEQFHFISTVYVCGKLPGPISETIHEPSPEFHNEYERSKWHAEELCQAWARQENRRLAITRPSIVVGDAAQGRATVFSGLYLMFRAADMLSQMAERDPTIDRHAMPHRIRARPDDRMNLVGVQYVTSMVAAMVSGEAMVTGIHHLVNPNPPSMDLIRRAIESYFDIGGGQFIDPSIAMGQENSEFERVFDQVISSIRPYLIDTPAFERRGAIQCERDYGITCQAIDEPYLHRLIRFAQSVNWGKKRSGKHQLDEQCAEYFERYLPENLPHSQVARMHGLNATVRFIIDDVENGQWVCRFEDGQLTKVLRGSNGLQEEFSYKTNRHHFWQAVSGGMDPQDIFLSGHADVTGDTEKALKMAMILQAFSREFPFASDKPAPSRRGGA